MTHEVHKPASASGSTTTGKYTLLSVLAFALCYLPFIGKAFHIDGPFFLDAAGMLDWNPFHVEKVRYAYFGRSLELTPYKLSHLPLVPYFIKAVVSLAGVKEWVLHLVFMAFPALALISLVSIRKALYPEASATGKLAPFFLLAMPAFLVNSHSIMADVPALALLLASFDLYSRAFESGRTWSAYRAGIVMLLSVSAAYQYAAFSAVPFVYALAKRRRDINALVGALLPGVLMAGSYVVVQAFWPGLLPNVLAVAAGLLKEGLAPGGLLERLANVLAHIGVSMAFVLGLYAYMQGEWKGLAMKFVASIAVSGLISFFAAREYAAGYLLLLAGLSGIGVLTLVLSVQWAVADMKTGRSARGEFLLLWIAIAFFYNVLMLPILASARYVLPVLPPMLLLAAGALSRSERARAADGRTRGAAVLVVAAALVFGLMCAQADYRYAGVYRDFSKEAGAFGKAQGADVWYIGEWGMRHYMDRAGARYLLSDSEQPRKGDFIVVPEMPRLWEPSLVVQRKISLFAERGYEPGVSLKLFNRRSHAGFYAHQWGLLPFSVSDAPDEVFSIYSVTR